jgi:beta-N-acetylhexosaminidase
MIRLAGTSLDAGTADFLRANKIRAVCLFRQNMVDAAQLGQLTSDLREVMGPKALIAVDHEGGAVVRAPWLPALPSAMSLGASDDVALTRSVGAAAARGIKSLGFNWIFAPVLDLNNNLENPVIAERAFGADPRRSTELAIAWMSGSLGEHVACCVKHAPGHGDTLVDSHRGLPTVDKSLSALRALEFSPFEQASALAPAMMTAHIIYPALDPALPATLSRRVLTQLIREEWRYRGVVITDAMEMAAITEAYGVEKAAVQALLAGADMIMALGPKVSQENQERTLDALADAIVEGRIAPAELAARLERLDSLAARYPCATGTARSYAQEDADRDLMRLAWQRGMTAFRNPIAPKPGDRIRLVMRADNASNGISEAGASAQHLAALAAELYDVECTTFADANSFDWQTLPDDGRTVILASTSRARYGENARRNWRPDLHWALWNPFHVLDIDAPAVITYGFAAPALEALAGWLRGELRLTGKNPCLVD